MEAFRLKPQIQTVGLSAGTVLLSLALFIVTSCQDGTKDTEAQLEALDTETTQLEVQESAPSDDASDIAMDVMATDDANSGGRFGNDHRLACAEVTRTGDKSAGTITLNFGEGCKDLRGNVRKGIIVIDYTGLHNVPGSVWVFHFTDYSLNDKQIEGTRTVTNISESGEGDQTFSVVMEDGTITWPDNTVGKRRVHHQRLEQRDQNHILNRLIISGSSDGTTHKGREYYIEILESLVYERSCADEGVFIPVKGKKLVEHGERQITIDYGDGTCDNTVTITNKNGRSWSYTVKK